MRLGIDGTAQMAVQVGAFRHALEEVAKRERLGANAFQRLRGALPRRIASPPRRPKKPALRAKEEKTPRLRLGTDALSSPPFSRSEVLVNFGKLRQMS